MFLTPSRRFSRHLHGHLRQSGQSPGAPGQRGAQGDARPATDHPDGRLRVRPRAARRGLRRPGAGHAGSGGAFRRVVHSDCCRIVNALKVESFTNSLRGFPSTRSHKAALTTCPMASWWRSSCSVVLLSQALGRDHCRTPVVSTHSSVSSGEALCSKLARLHWRGGT